MKRSFIAMSILAAVFFFSSMASAHVFFYPPENHVPGWQTSFPYQRNAYLSFTFDPGLGIPSGIPGAIYEGWMDDYLKQFDEINWQDISWNQDGSGIGVVPGVGGAISVHFANLADLNPAKRLYVEARYGNWLNRYQLSWVYPTIKLPEGFFVIDKDYDIIRDVPGTMTLRAWYLIEPNPPWEEIIFPLDFPEETYAWLEDIHIATECVVPLPSAIVLFGSGLLAIWGTRKKQER